MSSDLSFLGDPSRGRLRRSVLTVPAINARALDKVGSLDCDAVIFDLEDSVAPEMKEKAREMLARYLLHHNLGHRESVIRINGLGTQDHAADFAMVLAVRPNAVLLPKVEDPAALDSLCAHIQQADPAQELRLWAMMETPLGILNAAAIAATGRRPGARLDALVVGLNDLRKATGIAAQRARTYLVPYLMQVVLAARAFGLDVIDSVSNDFRDLASFDQECMEGRAMGFDGKMLIHPAQIFAANKQYGPSDDEVAQALRIVDAFCDPAHVGLNVITLDGQMIERLHKDDAERLLARAAMINARKESLS